MKNTIVGLLAETSIHPGSGTDVGFVDLPVAREAATDYPVLVGSSLKGALLDHARNGGGMEEEDRKRIFGEQDNAGALVVSDGRLLLLPVRSMTSHYKWVTCPHLLERYRRDMERGGCAPEAAAVPSPPPRRAFLGAETVGKDLFLEERQFNRKGDLPKGLVDLLGQLVLHEETCSRLVGQLVVLHDDDFAWFARYGLAINARNVLDEKKKTSKNLWYEETVPPDSLFYTLLVERGGREDAVEQTLRMFHDRPYLQVGGNASVGQGWFAVCPLNSHGGTQ